jgi:hypothetical protein
VRKSLRLLGVFAGTCVLLGASVSGATPATVTLHGEVTESLDAAYSPGDALHLTLDYSSDFVGWWNGGAGDGTVRARLTVGDPVADLPGMWTRAEVRAFDVRTGQEVPMSPSPHPFLFYQLDVAFDAGTAPELLRFSGVLRWHSSQFPADFDGTEFLEHFEGGQVELIRNGAPILRGLLVPEPSTALLTTSGLVALTLWSRRRRAD